MFDSTRHPALWAGLMGVCLGVGMGITLDRIHLFDVAHAQMCCSQFDVPLNEQLESPRSKRRAHLSYASVLIGVINPIGRGLRIISSSAS